MSKDLHLFETRGSGKGFIPPIQNLRLEEFQKSVVTVGGLLTLRPQGRGVGGLDGHLRTEKQQSGGCYY